MRMHLVVAVAAVCTVGCLSVPLAAERPGDDVFAPATAATGVELEVVSLQVAHQTAPRCAAAGEASCLSQMQIVYVATLVRHPRGTFLIDAALSDRSRETDIRRMPLEGKLAFNYTVDGSLRSLVAAAGETSPSFVLLTHAHWDHTSGLADLPNPRVVLGPGELEFVSRYHSSGTQAVMPWHFLGTRPETFAWDGPRYENFERSHDWFGDGSVVLVPLPGHTPGSIGVFLNGVHGRRLFFIGDTAWSMDGVTLPSHKASLLSDQVDDNLAQLSDSLWRVHDLHAREPEILIVPAHDGAANEAVRKLARTIELPP
jgi:N-acyl homoserine lactone hydrolase